ncbi:hypothetical protein IWX49DRAFT_509274 [Phyllosticta citricarpa]|uniref:polynucleotide adenylyltransferase n=1 Tax=Phyllosticta citricarpa TaxID=55181 RepID=A0ABR1MFC0_9PEZI
MSSGSPQILSHQNPRGPMRGPGQPAAQLYDPYSNQRQQFFEHQQKQASAQSNYLGRLATSMVPGVAMTDSELNDKLGFVDRLQKICQAEMSNVPNVPKLEFKCFGSIGTGFVTKGSDIDLAVVAQNEDDTESARKYGPRALEKIFLDNGFGARLLTNTRVPIIKFCERPSEELLENLRAERKKWDDLSEEEKAAILEGTDKSSEEDAAEGQDDADTTSEASPAPTKDPNTTGSYGDAAASKGRNTAQDKSPSEHSRPAIRENQEDAAPSVDHRANQVDGGQRSSADPPKHDSRQEKPWLREKPLGPLDFPKEGVGILCDLNFAGHLGIYNTRLLHCYATSDQRVRDMVIFVKAWAKKRKINSSYNGTLSSYGYALMVLHYLMRVPNDPVIQDLQSPLRYANETASPNWVDVVVEGHRVKFCGDEKYIQDMKQKGQWTKNRDSLGALLRGFFSYYGRPGIPDRVGGFHWTRDVITFGQRKPWERMVTKGELGWTRARVEKNSKKEVRHRYLVCIQDPFELDHNVGRTVSHQGIVAIREEFRRAWRILEEVAQDRPHMDIFDSIEDDPPQPQFFGNNNHNNNSQQSDRRDDMNLRQGGPPSVNTPKSLDSPNRPGDATHAKSGNASSGSRRSYDPTPAEARAMMAQKQEFNASNANSPSHEV